MSLEDVQPGPTQDLYTGLADEYPDVDRHSCQLLGPTALIVQGLMGVLVILSLVYKRHREKPMRPWRIWLFDVSKQVVGQMFVHGVNVLSSDLISGHSSSNACVYYFLNVLIDTTLGVALIYLILHVLANILTEKLHLKGFESGVYGTPPSVKFWARQAAIYVVALTTMKFMVIALLGLFPGLDQIGEWLLSWTWTGDGDSVQVIFTMGLFPIVMNILQFWLIDSIVKASAVSLSLDSETPDAFDAAREPLFGVPSDDDEDDDSATRPHDIENPFPVTHSHSPPHSRSHSTDKTMSGSTTPEDQKYAPSGSNTPGDNLAMHAYPPSLDSSIASISSTSSNPPSIKEATKLNKKRRSPPSPLSLQTAHPPAVNSPSAMQPTPKSSKLLVTRTKPRVAPAPVVEPVEEAWAESWDDSDDWANRVGEEEWTGRRLEEKQDALHNVWGNHNPTVHIAT